MATLYDHRVTRGERPPARPLNRERVIAAGERMLAEGALSPQLAASVESNVERLRAELADEPKQPKPPERSRAKPAS